jgi:hypothetical protein
MIRSIFAAAMAYQADGQGEIALWDADLFRDHAGAGLM